MKMIELLFGQPQISRAYLLVHEFVTCFEQDSNATEAYNHIEKFDTQNLYEDEHNAIMYYWKRLLNPPKSYFLPIAAPEDFVMGKNAAWSVHITLAVEHMDGREDEIPFMGYYSDEECEEGQQFLKELIEDGF